MERWEEEIRERRKALQLPMQKWGKHLLSSVVLSVSPSFSLGERFGSFRRFFLQTLSLLCSVFLTQVSIIIISSSPKKLSIYSRSIHTSSWITILPTIVHRPGNTSKRTFSNPNQDTRQSPWWPWYWCEVSTRARNLNCCSFCFHSIPLKTSIPGHAVIYVVLLLSFLAAAISIHFCHPGKGSNRPAQDDFW